MHKTIRTIVVLLTTGRPTKRRAARSVDVVRRLRVLRLVRVAHEVPSIAVAIASLLSAPDLLLTGLVREHRLGKGRGRGGELAARVTSKLVAVVVEAEVQLQPVRRRGVGVHGERGESGGDFRLGLKSLMRGEWCGQKTCDSNGQDGTYNGRGGPENS